MAEQLPSPSRSFLLSNLSVGAGTLLSRVTGFGRMLALAYAIGIGGLSDVYNTAATTPNIIYELMLGGILSATLLPAFVRALKDQNDKAISAILSVTTILLFGLTLIMVIAAPVIMQFYSLTRQHDPTQFIEVGTHLIRFFMPQIFFFGVVSMATALLNAQHKFAIPAYTPVLNNLIVIGVLVSLPHVFGPNLTLQHAADNMKLVAYLGMGSTAGIALSALCLLPAMLRSGIKIHFSPDWKHPDVQRVLKLSGWTFGYVLANQAALYFISLMALSHEGWITAYQMAFAFFILPHGLLAMTITTTFLPKMAHDAALGDMNAFSDKLLQGLKILMFLILPASVGYMLIAHPLLITTMNHGAFTLEDAHLTSGTLIMFALGLFPFSAYLFLLRGFYALSDTKTPFKLNLIENVINIVLAVPLIKLMGVAGLSLSYALAYCCAACLTFWSLNRRLEGRLLQKNLLIYGFKILMICSVMAIGVYAVLDVMSVMTVWVQLICAVVSGAAIYALLSLFAKTVDVKLLLRR